MATAYLYHLLPAGWAFTMAHGFSSCVVWALQCWLNSCSLRAYVNSCPTACRILVLQPGIEPTSPALEGRFLTTRPPGKWSESHSAVSDSLGPQWNSLGQNTGVVDFLFSRGSSQLRSQTQVSRIAGGFFTSWATREADHPEGPMFSSSWYLTSPSSTARGHLHIGCSELQAAWVQG